MVGVASANGGPVEWTEATAGGGLAPMEVDVVLLDEDLRIKVAGNARDFDVVATYRLSNPGPARRITFGVPVTWADEAIDEQADTRPATRNPHARAMARTVCA